MASIFTYQDEPPRIHSPWSTPGTSTPQASQLRKDSEQLSLSFKLEPERHDGPTEYKLHLLLRPRAKFRSASASNPAQTAMPAQIGGLSHSLGDSPMDRPHTQPSVQARQNRLHQLTTQLLWRLQQSSPFHSSSNADLVLPLLPEATPRLGLPDRPQKLLPGLEESQGALYEIGVADDGILVGLLEEELQESLNNLAAMAASLGCVTKLLRKVAVGSCDWADEGSRLADDEIVQPDRLWVAEVLVYPDSRKSGISNPPREDVHSTPNHKAPSWKTYPPSKTLIEQIRVTLLGPTASGKSSLLGTLSASVLDNGRGKSRLSLLKHRHEIASGITSSVAQELVGYAEDADRSHSVVNYASGDVSSWTDIHNLSERLVFVSDSPGLPRYAKSAFRALISWNPAWTVLCVAANDQEQLVNSGDHPTIATSLEDSNGLNDSTDTADTAQVHLDLCLRLNLPLIITITKMDLANKTGLRTVLAKILSRLKAAGRKPVMLSNSLGSIPLSESGDALRSLQQVKATDVAEVESVMGSIPGNNAQQVVPIVMTSAVTGVGISKLHALFWCLRSSTAMQSSAHPTIRRALMTPSFHVDEVFSIPPSRVYSAEQQDLLHRRGVVLCGHVAVGTISIGDTFLLGPFHSTSHNDSASPLARQRLPRSFSYSSRGPMHAERPPSILPTAHSPIEDARKTVEADKKSGPFFSVRIVSLRNLRLPVNELHQGETGTVGVELATIDQIEMNILARARRGMVLLDSSLSDHNADRQELTGYQSFSATFPSSDFSHAQSPPLILGGHALVYVNSIRAAAKVTAVALDDERQHHEDAHATLSSELEVFAFDSDEETHEHGLEGNGQGRVLSREKDIKITFRFVSAVEWMQMGDQVLVVPTVTAPGPIAGNFAPNVSPFAGFVGRVCDCKK